MKKVLVLGVGAQGSAAAKRLDLEPNVEEVICADYDPKAVENIVSQLKRAEVCRWMPMTRTASLPQLREWI